MKVLRTPEERFAGLPDFGYQPRYADADGLRLAYVEAGPPAGEPVLLCTASRAGRSCTGR